MFKYLCQKQTENKYKFALVCVRKNISQKTHWNLLLHHRYINMKKVAKLIICILARLADFPGTLGPKYLILCVRRVEGKRCVDASRRKCLLFSERMCHISELKRINTRAEFVHVHFRQNYFLWLKADKIIACLEGTHTILICKKKINMFKYAIFSLTWHSGLDLNFKPQFLFWLMVEEQPVLHIHNCGMNSISVWCHFIRPWKLWWVFQSCGNVKDCYSS